MCYTKFSTIFWTLHDTFLCTLHVRGEYLLDTPPSSQLHPRPTVVVYDLWMPSKLRCMNFYRAFFACRYLKWQEWLLWSGSFCRVELLSTPLINRYCGRAQLPLRIRFVYSWLVLLFKDSEIDNRATWTPGTLANLTSAGRRSIVIVRSNKLKERRLIDVRSSLEYSKTHFTWNRKREG